MNVYTKSNVEKILKNYIDIRLFLLGKGQQFLMFVTEREVSSPFSEPRHAKTHIDGKAKARLIEELHVSCLDLEKSLRCLHANDLELVYRYYIFQTHTLDELLVFRGIQSRSAMQRYLQRIVEKLTRVLNSGQ